jgi:outer membrane lipoprotein-sorting protein
LSKKIFLLLAVVLLFSAATADDKKTGDLFNQAVKTVNSLKDCSVKYRDDNTAGPEQRLRAHFVYEGKYINHPRLYYQRVLECEFNYPEQTTPGFQEMYKEDGDMIYILPPSYRALGMISLYPEDPKSFGPRGENTKSSGPWDFVNEVAAIAKNGKLGLESSKVEGRDCYCFEAVQSQGSFYRVGINRARLCVDQKTLLPVRIEKFEPNWPKPVVSTTFEEFKPNTGLTPDDLKFEGLKNPFSMIKTPSGAEFEAQIKTAPRTKLKDQGPEPQAVLQSFGAAADKINDYRADLTMGYRYYRLRLYREDRFAYHRNPYWFTLYTTVQKANYLLLSHSAGSALWYSPADKNLHLVGGGVQKIMGEQVFSGIDYKFYDNTGDNPYQLDFPSLKKIIAESFTNDKARAWITDCQGKKMWELELYRTGQTPPLWFGKINLVIDPETGLPAVLELSGYDDPKALVAMTFSNIKTNTGTKPGETKF